MKGREGKEWNGMEGGREHSASAVSIYSSIYNLKDRNILEKKNISKGDADG